MPIQISFLRPFQLYLDRWGCLRLDFQRRTQTYGFCSPTQRILKFLYLLYAQDYFFFQNQQISQGRLLKIHKYKPAF